MSVSFKQTKRRTKRRLFDQFEAAEITDQEAVSVVKQCRASFGKENTGPNASTWGYAVVYEEHIAKTVSGGKLKEQGVFQTKQRMIVLVFDFQFAMQFKLMFP